MPLTNDQQVAFEQIMESMKRRRNHVLKGYAGTGKTYLCEQILKQFRNPIIAAPTNKAVQVLSEATGYEGLTLAKMLGLRLYRGKLVQSGDVNLAAHDILIIDETSMVGSYYFKLIQKFVPSSVPILFVGDPAQLPPIGEDHSKTFDFPNVSQLTEIVRQAAGNPIIEYSKQLREGIFDPNKIPFDGDKIRRIDVKDFDQVLRLAIKGSKKGSIVAAWRNKTCDDVNYGSHDMEFGSDSTDFVEGEQIIFQEPLVAADHSIVMNNSDITTVRSCELGEVEDHSIKLGSATFRTWKIVTEEGYEFMTLHRDEKVRFKHRLDQYEDLGDQDRLWMMKEKVTEIKHTYAMTCHKLQGSTYKSVLITARDIMANRNKQEMTRCMYVAVTRAQNRIGFFI